MECGEVKMLAQVTTTRVKSPCAERSRVPSRRRSTKG